MPALWSTRPVLGPRLRRLVNLLFVQAGLGVAIAIVDLRARGELLGEHYGPPLLLIAFELALSLAALLLAVAIRGGQRTALGPLVVIELGWFGAAAWAVLSGGGAAIAGALIAMLTLVRLADAKIWAEARSLAPYDQQVMLAEEHGVGFTISTVPQPFGEDAGWTPPTIAAPTKWGRRSTDRLPR